MRLYFFFFFFFPTIDWVALEHEECNGTDHLIFMTFLEIIVNGSRVKPLGLSLPASAYWNTIPLPQSQPGLCGEGGNGEAFVVHNKHTKCVKCKRQPSVNNIRFKGQQIYSKIVFTTTKQCNIIFFFFLVQL